MKFICCLLAALLIINSTRGNTLRKYEQDIPQRCVDKPAPEVSCANVSEDSLMPHPGDCELFFYCVDGESKPVCRQCPAQLHFNPTKHVCDVPDVAGCSISSDFADIEPATTELDNRVESLDSPSFSVECSVE